MSTRHSASKKRRISRTINGMTNLNQLNTMQSLGSTSPVVGTKRKKKTTRKPTNSHSANMNAPTARKTQHHTAKAFGEAGGVYQAIGDFIVAMDADLLAMRNNCVEQGHALAEQMKKYQNNMHSPYQQTNLRRSALLQQAIDQSGGLNPLNTTEKRLQMRNSKSNFTETIQSLNNMEIDSELVESIDSYENKMKVAGNEFDLANLALFNNANKLISTSLELTADGNTVLVCKLQKQKFSLSERTLLAEEIVNLKLSTHGGGKSEDGTPKLSPQTAYIEEKRKHLDPLYDGMSRKNINIWIREFRLYGSVKTGPQLGKKNIATYKYIKASASRNRHSRSRRIVLVHRF
jgi:hypothetical protein